MRIVVKLFASLGEFLPSGAERNQIEMDFPVGTTVAGVIEHFKVPPDKAHLVVVNGVFLPPAERATRELLENEELAVFPPVAGG